jgi:hypothetical protein
MPAPSRARRPLLRAAEVTADTYTHVLSDERELDYESMLG